MFTSNTVVFMRQDSRKCMGGNVIRVRPLLHQVFFRANQGYKLQRIDAGRVKVIDKVFKGDKHFIKSLRDKQWRLKGEHM